MAKIWIRKKITTVNKIVIGSIGIILLLILWIGVTTARKPKIKIDSSDFNNKILSKITSADKKEYLLKFYEEDKINNIYLLKKKINTRDRLKLWTILTGTGYINKNNKNPVMSPNVLPHPFDIIKALPGLLKGTKGKGFVWQKSLFFAVWISLRRELISFGIVVIFALLIGIFMSCNAVIRAFYMPFLVIGTFIPIAALIPLTQAFLGIEETQKIVFLSLGMFFVLLALVMKEMDEVDDIYLQTAYTLGFSQLQTVFLVNLPTALPRIWKHFSAIFGLGWGYIIFAEMINVGGSDFVNGIGWLFIARKRRLQIPDMYAIFFVIILLAFLFSYLFDLASKGFFKHERKLTK